MTRHPTTLTAANSDPRVDSAYRDSDGVWIELTYGWANLYDEPHGNLHGIHEDTVRDALRKLRGAGPCGCHDCVAGLAKAVHDAVEKIHALSYPTGCPGGGCEPCAARLAR
jgi:hypothetical protein